MLFNSYIFIFIFLPLVLLGFHLIGKRGHHRVAISWLVGASLFFYGWWNPAYLGFILASIIFNYASGITLGEKPSKLVLTFAVTINLSLIGYFKYANFFIDNVNILFNRDIHLEQIILPLAISFFTFQQITYLTDAYRGLTKEYNFLHYCLFVTFFPQLIAGPIVHHKEMLPQFANDAIYKLKASNLSIGITLFVFGLFKKVVFADNIATYASPIFEAANNGIQLTFFEAWVGALAYTLQLYFDFSGYSDMAVGLAKMFGVTLPINFYSPYKANSIIEFWRRWHITLSRFLRDYLYIPLGGSRRGIVRRYMNLMITMLLGGLWHGAGWTFILWGGMHGIFLSINHCWNVLIGKVFDCRNKSWFIGKVLGRIVTFTAVVFAWVMFRSENLNTAVSMYSAMLGLDGISFHSMFHNDILSSKVNGIMLLFVMVMIVWFSPNTYDWLRNEKPVLDSDTFISGRANMPIWRFNTVFAMVLALLSIVCIFSLSSPSEFLYFQF